MLTPPRTGPTMDDVAARAGVSRATVSRVLGRRVAVADSTREQVLRAINELGHVPNVAARQLAGGTNSVVGLLLRDPRTPAYGLLHSQIGSACFAAGLHLITAVPSPGQGDEFERGGLSRLLGSRVAGLFIATGVVSSESLSPFLSVVPTVSLGRVETNPGVYAVSYDEDAHAHAIADWVIAHGHRRVGVLVVARSVSLGEHRRSTQMVQRFRDRGVEVVEVHATHFGARHENNDVMLRLVREKRITAAVFPTDNRAIGFLELCAKGAVRVPEDVSVTGCDGIVSGLPLIGLATLRIPVESVARRGAEVMRQLLTDRDSLPVHHEKHAGVLVEGRTLNVPADPD